MPCERKCRKKGCCCHPDVQNTGQNGWFQTFTSWFKFTAHFNTHWEDVIRQTTSSILRNKLFNLVPMRHVKVEGYSDVAWLLLKWHHIDCKQCASDNFYLNIVPWFEMRSAVDASLLQINTIHIICPPPTRTNQNSTLPAHSIPAPCSPRQQILFHTIVSKTFLVNDLSLRTSFG